MITPPSRSFKPGRLHPELEPKAWMVLCDFTSHINARKSASTTHKRMVATSAVHCDAHPAFFKYSIRQGSMVGTVAPGPHSFADVGTPPACDEA